MPNYLAAMLSNEALGFQPPGRLDWTDARGRLHRVRCVHAGNTWAYSDRAEPAQGRAVAGRKA